MIHRSITAIALAGATASAAPTINITPDHGGGFGDTITWTVSATGVDSTDFLQAYDFSIVGLGTAGYLISDFSTSLSLVVNPTPGTPGAGSIIGVSGGQSTLLDPLDTSFGDVELGSFTTICQSFGTIFFTLQDAGILATPIVRFRQGSDFGPITFEGDDVDVVSGEGRWLPAPSSAAIIMLAGVITPRRRRP